MFTALSEWFHLQNSHLNRAKGIEALGLAFKGSHMAAPPVSSLTLSYSFTWVQILLQSTSFSLWQQDVTILIHWGHHFFSKRSYSSQSKSYKSLSPWYIAWTTVLDTVKTCLSILSTSIMFISWIWKLRSLSNLKSRIPNYLQDDVILILLISKGIKGSPRVDSYQLRLPYALPCPHPSIHTHTHIHTHTPYVYFSR